MVHKEEEDDDFYYGDVRFSNRSRETVSYYNQEVDEFLGTLTDSDEERKRKKKQQVVNLDIEDETVIDAVCDHKPLEGMLLRTYKSTCLGDTNTYKRLT